MPSRSIVVRLRLLGQKEFVSGTTAAAGASTRLGAETEAAGRKAHVGAKGFLKMAAATAVLYRGFHFLSESVETTTSLARATLSLQRQTGLETTQASAWVNMAKLRGVAVVQLNRGMIGLSKAVDASAQSDTKAVQRVRDLTLRLHQLESAPVKSGAALVAREQQLDRLRTAIERAGGAATGTAGMFRKLGLSQADLAAMTPEQRIEEVSEALKALPNASDRAVIGSKLFGRAWIQLSSLMLKGKEGIRENIDEQKRLHATISDTKGAIAMIEAEHRYETAMLGLKVTLGTTLIPALTILADRFSDVLERSQPVFQFIQKNGKTVMLLAGSFLFLIASIKVFNGLTKTVENVVKAATAAQWLWNAALDANPVGAIILAVAILVGSLVLLYKRNKGFRDFVRGVFESLRKLFHGVVRFFDQLIARIETLGRKAKRVRGWFSVSGIDIAKGVAGQLGIPGAAAGGTVMRSGNVLVGEQGPEILSLPTGANVTPLAAPAVLARGVSGQQTLVTKVYLDKRQIALAVAEVNADRRARK